MHDEIGTAAGTIWRYLDEHGETTLAKLKQGTEVSDQLLLMGLGWLAREGKIRLVRGKQVTRVMLSEARR
jgi:hypothetical protein